jgi:hypothetical protein
MNGLHVTALLLTRAALAQDLDLQIKLMGLLGTKTSHKGDRVYGRIRTPDSLKGDTVEGTSPKFAPAVNYAAVLSLISV